METHDLDQVLTYWSDSGRAPVGYAAGCGVDLQDMDRRRTWCNDPLLKSKREELDGKIDDRGSVAKSR